MIKRFLGRSAQLPWRRLTSRHGLEPQATIRFLSLIVQVIPWAPKKLCRSLLRIEQGADQQLMQGVLRDCRAAGLPLRRHTRCKPVGAVPREDCAESPACSGVFLTHPQGDCRLVEHCLDSLVNSLAQQAPGIDTFSADAVLPRSLAAILTSDASLKGESAWFQKPSRLVIQETLEYCKNRNPCRARSS